MLVHRYEILLKPKITSRPYNLSMLIILKNTLRVKFEVKFMITSKFKGTFFMYMGDLVYY